jgi:hypothetical protein
MQQHLLLLLLLLLLLIVSDEATKGSISLISHVQSCLSDCLPGITMQLARLLRLHVSSCSLCISHHS